uniref:Uncharacterized protein n=1 Tax=Octopus bimaculoides TaxID=37653 RepID=A0A0L8I325_OCTBM
MCGSSTQRITLQTTTDHPHVRPHVQVFSQPYNISCPFSVHAPCDLPVIRFHATRLQPVMIQEF